MIKRDPLVMIPGPTPVEDSILSAMDYQTYGHTYKDFVEQYKETLSNLKKIFFTDGEVVVVGGAGTLAMEMAVVNTLKRNDNFLVVSHGHFGNRFVQLAERYSVNVDVIQAEPGKVVSPDEIDSKLSQKKYQAISVTHVDTSTGVSAPLKDIAKVMEKFPDTLYFVDGVCASGGLEERMKDWGIDVIITAAQKCFGVPPGLAICAFSPKALERRKTLGTIPNYYCDLDLWLPIMNDPTKYFSTPPVNLILGMKESTRIIMEEGIETRFARHEKFGQVVRSGIRAMGLDVLPCEEDAAGTLSTVLYPDEIKDKKDADFRSALLKNGVLVAGGLGPLAGKIFRLGHMGNIGYREVLFSLSAIELSLKETGYNVEPGSGIAAAEKAILE